MRRCKYELKRLPDINGEMNWSIKRYEPFIYRMVSWDYDKIREFVFWQGEYSWEKTIHPNGGKTYEEALFEGIRRLLKF